MKIKEAIQVSLQNLSILVLALCLACEKPTKPSTNINTLALLTQPDREAVILIALKHNADTAKVNKLIQCYLDRYDLLHLALNGKNNDLLQAMNPKGQFKVIDSLSVALLIPRETSASILYDYILFTKKCGAEDNSYYEPKPDE